MEPNNGATPLHSFDEEPTSLQDVLAELRVWRRHVNRKEEADDEQLLRTFTDMGEVATAVHQRTQQYKEPAL